MLGYWGTGLRPIPQTPTPILDKQNYSRARAYRGHARTISNIVGEKLSKCAVSFSNSKQGDGITRRVMQITMYALRIVRSMWSLALCTSLTLSIRPLVAACFRYHFAASPHFVRLFARANAKTKGV